MSRKARSDSAGAALARFRSLETDLTPPAHTILHEGAEPFYLNIVECRAPDMWNAVDLSRAVELANTQLAIQTEKQALLAEGSVLVNDKGTSFQNPRIGIISMYSRLEISMAKQLQTDAINTQGQNIDVKKRNKAHGKTLAIVESIGHDPLLAGME